MDRDLAELLKYYKCMLEFGNALSNMGKELDAEADTAASMLGDSVSARCISGIRECSSKLRITGDHIITESEKELRAVIKDKNDFDAL